MKQIFYALKRFFRREIPVTDFDEKIVRNLVVHTDDWMIDRVNNGPAVTFRARHRGVSVEVGVARLSDCVTYSALIAQQGGIYPEKINETLAENLWWALQTRHEAQQRQFRAEWMGKTLAKLDDLDSKRVSDNTE